MATNEPESANAECDCDCHDEGICPRLISVDSPSPMSAELIKTSFLKLHSDEEDADDSSVLQSPIIDDLDGLFQFLSNHGLFKWAQHVFGYGRDDWNLDWPQQVKILNEFNREIDKRFPVPSDRTEVLRTLELRDGSGCACRRSRPACGFHSDSDQLLQDYEIAHITPRGRGGKHVWSNLALISPRCNQSQGSKLFLTWLEEQLKRECTRFLTWPSQWPSNRPLSASPSDLIATVRLSWGPKRT